MYAAPYAVSWQPCIACLLYLPSGRTTGLKRMPTDNISDACASTLKHTELSTHWRHCAQEFAGLPLRLSRQLSLDTVNAAASALGRLVAARLAHGAAPDAAGDTPANLTS